MTTLEHLSKFSLLYVEFPEGNLRQLASGDCNLQHLLSMHVLKFRCQANRGQLWKFQLVNSVYFDDGLR